MARPSDPSRTSRPARRLPRVATRVPSTLRADADTQRGSPLELVTKKRLQLYSGRTHPELAQEIADNLGVKLGEPNIQTFKNGEIHCQFDESVRGSDVFIIQTHGDPVNESIMEQVIMIDAAKRGSAKRITAVCPYYGYARQD